MGIPVHMCEYNCHITVPADGIWWCQATNMHVYRYIESIKSIGPVSLSHYYVSLLIMTPMTHNCYRVWVILDFDNGSLRIDSNNMMNNMLICPWSTPFIYCPMYMYSAKYSVHIPKEFNWGEFTIFPEQNNDYVATH